LGAWGTGLFEDDTASDVRAAFLDLLAAGREPPAATRELLTAWTRALGDSDDGPLVWLALAATQWEHGCLERDVLSRALVVIDSAADLAKWDGAAARSQRQAVLADLRKQLLSPQPRFRRPKPRKPVIVPSIDVVSPDGPAKATAYQLAGPTELARAQMQVFIQVQVRGGWGGGGVFVADCPYDQVNLSWRDADTLEIQYPGTAERVTRKDQLFHAGRIVKVTYRC
jgi:hypothetical protein